MQVYFLKTVPGVGREKTVGNVQPGYARNFLFPKKLAVVATSELLRRTAREQDVASRDQAKQAAQEQAILALLRGQRVIVRERADGKKLFGSVTKEKLAAAIEEQVHAEVPFEAVRLARALDQVGDHQVEVHFSSGSATITVTIQPYA